MHWGTNSSFRELCSVLFRRRPDITDYIERASPGGFSCGRPPKVLMPYDYREDQTQQSEAKETWLNPQSSSSKDGELDTPHKLSHLLAI